MMATAQVGMIPLGLGNHHHCGRRSLDIICTSKKMGPCFKKIDHVHMQVHIHDFRAIGVFHS
jgi:hypothetical protein